MAKNAELLNALNNAEFFSKSGQEDALKALGALVAAGNRRNEFAAALHLHRAFWIKFAGLENSDFENADELTADGNNDNDKLEALFKLAAEKRVRFGLQSASEDILKKIIAPQNEQDLRTALATDPVPAQIGEVHKAHGWAVDQQNVLTNAVVANIQLEAQRLLLAKKIIACTAADIKKVDDLFKAIAEGNAVEFTKAVKALGVDDGSAAKMAHNGVGPLVQAEAAKKSFAANVVNIYKENYTLESAYAQLNKTHAEFVHTLPEPYTDRIVEADAESIKGYLGAQYLYAKIDHMTLKDALKIAKNTSVDQLRASLKDGDDAFLAQAVVEQNVAEFRHRAGIQALKLQIEKTSDASALRSLLPARSPEAFQKILESSPLLGFAGEDGKELRAAFKNNTSPLYWLIPAAHVRLSVLEGKVEELQKLIKNEATPKLFRDKYYNSFPIDNGIANAFEAYFDNPDNRSMLRQQALLAVAKSKIYKLEPGALQGILDANNDGTLRTAISDMLGIADAADDLIADANDDSQVNKELRAYVKIALVVNSAPATGFDALLVSINGLQKDPLVKDILPASEIMSAQRKLALELLAKCPADKIDDLVDLTQAKNLEAMNEALRELGVTDLHWVSKDTMQALRNAALPHAIELKMDAVSTIGKGARPELLTLFKGFSPEKQQALLANDKLISAVMNATSVTKIAKMLDIADIVPGTPLHAEIERINLSSRIHNAAIAKTLAGMPFVVLTSDKVDQINAVLDDAGLDLKRETYIATIQKITADAGLIPDTSNATAYYKAFGLDPFGANYLGGYAEADLIISQYKHNGPTTLKLQGGTPAEKGIYKFLATLNKNAELDAGNIQKIVDQCKAATSGKDLIEKIKAITPKIEAVTLNSFEQRLTQDQYSELKRPFSQAKFLVKATLQTSIDADILAGNAELAELKKLTDINKGMKSELTRLSELSAMAWLNPAFQSAAHQNAHAMKQHFTELNDACNVIVTNLENRQAFFQEKLDSLPGETDVQGSTLSSPEQRSIEDHRKQLTKNRDEIAKDLAVYTKIQTVLQGNPNQPADSLTGKGVLTMLDEAMAGRPVKFLGYESKCVAYKKSTREDHFRQGYTGVKAAPMPEFVALGANTKRYEVDSENMKLGQDEYFEHTIGSGADEGYFIEEHGPRHQTPHYQTGKGKASAENVEFPVEVKLSPNKWPTTENGKIQTAMAMASRMLAGAKPGPDNKILLQTADGDKAKYVWTALMTQMMAMGMSAREAQKCITVRCPFFDPASQMGMLYGMADGSLYDTFMKSPIVTGQMADIQELTKDLTDSEKSKKEVKQDVEAVNKKFSEAKTVIQEMKDKNEANEDETPTIRIR